MLQRLRRPIVLFLPVAGLLACQSGEVPEPAAPGVEAPTFAAAGEEAAAEAEEPVAEAELEEPAAEQEEAAATHSVSTRVAINADGSTQLITEIVPGAGFKINVADGFPWRVSVAADAPNAAGTACGREGATTFEEASATFELNAGIVTEADAIAGRVVLGVCDDTGCIRVQEDVTWTLASR